MAKNITKKDFFNAIINVVEQASAEGADIDWGKVDLSTKDCPRIEEITSDMVIDFCKKEIELLTKKSTSKSNKTSKVTAVMKCANVTKDKTKDGVTYTLA